MRNKEESKQMKKDLTYKNLTPKQQYWENIDKRIDKLLKQE